MATRQSDKPSDISNDKPGDKQNLRQWIDTFLKKHPQEDTPSVRRWIDTFLKQNPHITLDDFLHRPLDDELEEASAELVGAGGGDTMTNRPGDKPNDRLRAALGDELYDKLNDLAEGLPMNMRHDHPKFLEAAEQFRRETDDALRDTPVPVELFYVMTTGADPFDLPMHRLWLLLIGFYRDEIVPVVDGLNLHERLWLYVCGQFADADEYSRFVDSVYENDPRPDEVLDELSDWIDNYRGVIEKLRGDKVFYA